MVLLIVKVLHDGNVAISRYGFINIAAHDVLPDQIVWDVSLGQHRSCSLRHRDDNISPRLRLRDRRSIRKRIFSSRRVSIQFKTGGNRNRNRRSIVDAAVDAGSWVFFIIIDALGFLQIQLVRVVNVWQKRF